MTVLAVTTHAGGLTAISPEHGGCGQIHEYVIGPSGYPQIDCPQCENFLRGDKQHAVSASKVPETADERASREDLETRLAKKQQIVQTIAAARIAGMDAEADMLAEAAGIPVRNTVAVCPQGHRNSAGQKFCGSCGAPLPPGGAAAPAAAPQPSEPAERPEPPAEVLAGRKPRLRDMPLAELRRLAGENGVDSSGTRTDLLARLKGM